MWWTKTARSALLLSAAAAALAGCSTMAGKTGPRGATAEVPNAVTPLDQYTIKVSPKPEELALGVHPYGLSTTQRDALAGYVAHWRESGGTETITVEAPASNCQCNPIATARAAAAALVSLGVPADRVRLSDYDGGGRPDAPVFARYTRFTASTTDCMDRWSNLVSTYDNSVTAHFGCAMTQNIAAQVADARDFLRPAATTPADGGRRDVVLENYRKGAATSSAKDDQATGTLSNAVH